MSDSAKKRGDSRSRVLSNLIFKDDYACFMGRMLRRHPTADVLGDRVILRVLFRDLLKGTELLTLLALIYDHATSYGMIKNTMALRKKLGTVGRNIFGKDPAQVFEQPFFGDTHLIWGDVAKQIEPSKLTCRFLQKQLTDNPYLIETREYQILFLLMRLRHNTGVSQDHLAMVFRPGHHDQFNLPRREVHRFYCAIRGHIRYILDASDKRAAAATFVDPNLLEDLLSEVQRKSQSTYGLSIAQTRLFLEDVLGIYMSDSSVRKKVDNDLYRHDLSEREAKEFYSKIECALTTVTLQTYIEKHAAQPEK